MHSEKMHKDTTTEKLTYYCFVGFPGLVDIILQEVIAKAVRRFVICLDASTQEVIILRYLYIMTLFAQLSVGITVAWEFQDNSKEALDFLFEMYLTKALLVPVAVLLPPVQYLGKVLFSQACNKTSHQQTYQLKDFTDAKLYNYLLMLVGWPFILGGFIPGLYMVSAVSLSCTYIIVRYVRLLWVPNLKQLGSEFTDKFFLVWTAQLLPKVSIFNSIITKIFDDENHAGRKHTYGNEVIWILFTPLCITTFWFLFVYIMAEVLVRWRRRFATTCFENGDTPRLSSVPQ